MYTGNPLTSTLANSEDVNEMPQNENVVFHQSMNYLL